MSMYQLQQLQEENLLLKKLLLEGLERNRMKASERPFLECYQEWLKVKKLEIQESTSYEYERVFNTYICPFFNVLNLEVSEVTSKNIEAFYIYLKQTKSLHSSSIIRVHSNLFTFFKYAVKNDIIITNPMAKVERPKSKMVRIIQYYDVDELIELFSKAKNIDIYYAIIIAGILGLRRSEVLGLKWEDIDLKKGTITIKRKMTRDKKNSKDKLSNQLKSLASYRTLVMPEFLVAELRRKRKLSYSSTIKQFSDHICTLSDGSLPTLNKITVDFRRFIQRNGFRKIRYHDLRHSCATLLLNLGYSMKDIQDWLGHSNYSTTANIYTHTNMHSKQKIADNLSQILA